MNTNIGVMDASILLRANPEKYPGMEISQDNREIR